MAVVAALIVAALCATGVGMYADRDRLVATVRWQHGCFLLGRPPLGHPEPPCLLHCACALCFRPGVTLHADAGVHCIAL